MEKHNREYFKLPKPIQIEVSNSEYCQCDNCHKTDKVHIIKYSKTDYEMENGKIGKWLTPKEREIWLCRKCWAELREEMVKHITQELFKGE